MAGCGSVVIDSLLIVTSIVEFCNCSRFYCALLCVHSWFAIILMGKKELVALLCLSFWCLVVVMGLFLPMPTVCLQFVFVAFSDHIYLLFLEYVGCSENYKLCIPKIRTSLEYEPRHEISNNVVYATSKASDKSLC